VIKRSIKEKKKTRKIAGIIKVKFTKI